MRALVALIICAAAFLLAAPSSFAKEWRGIVPLRSTRANVEQLLGTPTKKTNESEYYYTLKNEAVVVRFQAEACSECGRGWSVPSDTVTEVDVVPKRKIPVERLLSSEFEQGVCGIDYKFYMNASEGIEVESHKGSVTLIAYIPAASDEKLHCPQLRDCPLPQVRRFDEYGDISFEKEKWRLDNFASQLQSDPSLRGVIMAYGSRPHEAIRRAVRAKNYMVRVRGIESWRVVAVDGGQRDELTAQLNPLPMVGGIRFCAELH